MSEPPPASAEIGTHSGVGGIGGRVVDVDSHLMLGPEQLGQLISGRAGAALHRWAQTLCDGLTDEIRVTTRRQALADPWRVRGWLALGADDPSDRVTALDAMGIARQVVLPPVTLPPLLSDGRDAWRDLRRYNDLALDWVGAAPDRLLAAAELPSGDLDALLTEARRVVAAGARAVELGFARPPAGRSPADPALDPLWALLADAGVPLLLHAGGGGPAGAIPPPAAFLDAAWGATPRLRPGALEAPSTEAAMLDNGLTGPFDLATMHLPAEVFLTAVVLGGVLDRNPGLRIGVVELGAYWVAPWVKRLDGMATGMGRFGLPPLKQPPSLTIRRQVRVSPFYGEPVAEYITADGLSEVYTFSSDFPHSEGGCNPIGRFHHSLARLGDDVVERFFVTNAIGLLDAGERPQVRP